MHVLVFEFCFVASSGPIFAGIGLYKVKNTFSEFEVRGAFEQTPLTDIRLSPI